MGFKLKTILRLLILLICVTFILVVYNVRKRHLEYPGLRQIFKRVTQKDSKQTLKARPKEDNKLVGLAKSKFPFCKEIIKGNNSAITLAKNFMKENQKINVSETDYISFIEKYGCDTFKEIRNYRLVPTSEEEREFPIAFGIVIFKDIVQVERTLRVMYMPQNIYCYHIDRKSKPVVRKAMEKIASCFDNVFISSKSYDVWWGRYSVLEADMACQADLLKKANWKYFFNMAGQEFPLMSNRQMVRMVKAYGGASDNIVVRSSAMIPQWKDRTKFVFKWKDNAFWPIRTKKRKSPAPHNFKNRRGEIHLIASRKFVEFVLTDIRVKDYYLWLDGTNIPDESFYSTMTSKQSGICIPGSYNASEEIHFRNSNVRWKHWTDHRGTPKCNGKVVRIICIPGIADLPRIVTNITRPIINKLYVDFEYLTFDCLEEYILTLQNLASSDDFKFNDQYYKDLNLVKYQSRC